MTTGHLKNYYFPIAYQVEGRGCQTNTSRCQGLSVNENGLKGRADGEGDEKKQKIGRTRDLGESNLAL